MLSQEGIGTQVYRKKLESYLVLGQATKFMKVLVANL